MNFLEKFMFRLFGKRFIEENEPYVYSVPKGSYAEEVRNRRLAKCET